MAHSRDLALFVFGTTFVILLSTSCALPPDFFRNGRSKSMRLSAGKRAAAAGGNHILGQEVLDIITIACDYCQAHTQIQQMSVECQTNANIRRLCLEGFHNTVEYVVDTLSENWSKK